jgi:hypothetical protein
MRKGSDRRSVDLGYTTGPLLAALDLPDGCQCVAFFRRYLGPLLADPAAREIGLPMLSLVDLATLPLACNQSSMYEQKYQCQEAQ